MMLSFVRPTQAAQDSTESWACLMRSWFLDPEARISRSIAHAASRWPCANRWIAKRLDPYSRCLLTKPHVIGHRQHSVAVEVQRKPRARHMREGVRRHQLDPRADCVAGEHRFGESFRAIDLSISFYLNDGTAGERAIVVRRADDIFLVLQEACERITWKTHIGVDQKQMRVSAVERHLCEMISIIRPESAGTFNDREWACALHHHRDDRKHRFRFDGAARGNA